MAKGKIIFDAEMAKSVISARGTNISKLYRDYKAIAGSDSVTFRSFHRYFENGEMNGTIFAIVCDLLKVEPYSIGVRPEPDNSRQMSIFLGKALLPRRSA